MFNLRSLLLFSILIILGLFIVQNLGTVLPLVIFGIKTFALPLGFWVILALGLGFISSLILQLPRSFSDPRPRETQRQNQREFSQEEDFEEFPEPPSRKAQTYDRPAPEVNSDISDWDLDFDNDWQESPRIPNPPTKTTFQSAPKTTTGTAPSPPTNSKSSPSNSSVVKDENNSEVGKTGAVYDANYRVINAPFSPPPAVAKAQEEDWGLGEDDDSVFDFPDLETKKPSSNLKKNSSPKDD